jgi:hypothetical protein
MPDNPCWPIEQGFDWRALHRHRLQVPLAERRGCGALRQRPADPAADSLINDGSAT